MPGRSLSVQRLLVLSFAAAIVVGTLLLMLPGMVRTGPAHGPVEALFQATSAICVTGLAVRDLATYTHLGQLVVLLLIQAGALGIMTFSKLALLAGDRRLLPQERDLLEMTQGHVRWVGPREALRQTLAYTALCEGVGVLLLWPRFAVDHGLLEGGWLALFHAVSAFANAGFSTWGDSLAAYRGDLYINLVVMALVVAGGLGFMVATDAWTFLVRHRRGERPRLSLHTRTVLVTSAVLLVAGWLVLMAFEQGNPSRAGIGGDWLVGLFLSTSARTAGFSTCSLAELSNPSLLVLMVLMGIGGAPGSTAGGIKVTTFAVLVAVARSRAAGREDAELFGRSLSGELVGRAVATVSAFLLLIILATLALEVAQSGVAPHHALRGRFLAHCFEVISALCTVGLSTGITAELTDAGRLVIVLCMFVGRLGPLIVASAAVGRSRHLAYALPREDVMIG